VVRSFCSYRCKFGEENRRLHRNLPPRNIAAQRAGSASGVHLAMHSRSRIFDIHLWIRAIFILFDKFIPSPLNPMKTKLMYTLHSTIGIAASAISAVAVALIFARTPWKLAAPFFFAAVLVLLASRFGAMVSVVGSLLAAVIFALILFSPGHTLHVAGESERATLAWMILLSVSASYLLFPSRSGGSGF
jgi:K+-sensing histidine kinase KdpD